VVAKGGREETSFLPHPKPLGRDAKLAGRLRDRVGGAPVISHATTIEGAVTRTEVSDFRYPYLAVAMSYAEAGGRSQRRSRQEIGFGTKVLASLVRVI
jgi:hypothetical protein